MNQGSFCMTAEHFEALAGWLEEQSRAVRELEERARILIEEEGDQNGYEGVMRQKALLLAGLPDEGAAYLEPLDSPRADGIRARLESFAASANAALEIGSVFYMSALLYPEDHQTGQPNDLDAFAEPVRALARN
jgi:hypothetical protein